jgi:hypothetical protein
MDPDLVAAFAAEYIAERNRLAATKTDISAAMRKDLAKVIKDQDMLVNAILAGTPAERIKDRMAQLEQRQKQLEKDLAAAPASTAVLHIHPGMATDYQSRIKALIDGLTDAERPDREDRGDARANQGQAQHPVAHASRQSGGDSGDEFERGPDVRTTKNLLRTRGYGKCRINGCGGPICHMVSISPRARTGSRRNCETGG